MGGRMVHSSDHLELIDPLISFKDAMLVKNWWGRRRPLGCAGGNGQKTGGTLEKLGCFWAGVGSEPVFPDPLLYLISIRGVFLAGRGHHRNDQKG